jgi:predicted aldo/keto reductase-like oxidoreductase
MTWGNQNTEAEAHEQLSYAVDQGINFIDTAEMVLGLKSRTFLSLVFRWDCMHVCRHLRLRTCLVALLGHKKQTTSTWEFALL